MKIFSSLLTAGAFAVSVSCLASAEAVASESLGYRCKSGAQFLFVTTIPEEGRAVYEELGKTVDLRPDGRGGYFNDQEEISFSATGAPELWLGDVKTACEIAPVAGATQQTHATGAVGGAGTALNHQGRSLGGKLRDGPGTNFRQVGSLPEGTWLTLVANTGVRFDGYDWFEVVSDTGARGYQWGGILCSNGQKLAGIHKACSNQAAARPPVQTVAAGGWMAFALAPDGAFGHGAAPIRAGAEQFAMTYCGQSGCKVADATQARCHALALSPDRRARGIGSADNEAAASNFAIGWCSSKGARGCRIEYTYCQ